MRMRTSFASKINWGLNHLIELLKWPVALLMILLLVPAFKADIEVISKLTNGDVLLNFFLPFGAVIVLFLFIPGLAGSFFAIMEHELTHMLFAVLTFHKPRGLDVDQDRGGSFSFEGRGNWLIALAPYFFPTFWFVIVLFMPLFLPFFGKEPEFYVSLLGIFMGYNFISTLLSIHPKQTDFKVAGYLFTALFLPGVTCLKYGILFCYSIHGAKGLEAYFHVLMKLIGVYLKPFLG